MRHVILSLLLLFMFPGSGLASQPVLLVSMEFPPYVYSDNGSITGFNVLLLDKIFKKIDVDYRLELLPWARAVQLIKTGEADGIFPFFKTNDRSVYADFSDQFTTEDTALFIRTNSPIKWTGSVHSLVDYRFGRVRGYSSGKQLDDLIASGQIILDEVENSNLNIRKLLAERFDIVIEEKHVAYHELMKIGKDTEAKLLTIIQTNPAYVGFSKKRNRSQLIKSFNRVLNEMRTSGEYERTVEDYFKGQ